MNKRIVIVGAGVAGINAATKLVDNGYPGHLITIIDKGKDPNNRLPEEVMEGMLGAGGWSDGKLTYHTEIGGQLSKYCGEEKAMDLMNQVINNFIRFHPKPDDVFYSNPKEQPDFIKPYFDLRLFPVWHIGSNYLHEIAINWYNYLVNKGVEFLWETEVKGIDFNINQILYSDVTERIIFHDFQPTIIYDNLILAVGKSGIDLGKKIAYQYQLPTEPKSVQIGVRFEAPQKYFQKLIDVSYDFKLYQKPNENVSIRTFCTNNTAAYVAVEHTYGDVTYNGHAKKGDEFRNDMTNFAILMEIKGIENPFEWSRNVVYKLQFNGTIPRFEHDGISNFNYSTGLYYSPNQTRRHSLTSEGIEVSCLELTHGNLKNIMEPFDGYFEYIENFINQMNEIFQFGDDWGIYIPEVKYLNPEPVVNHENLSLIDYPNVYFAGDVLSARGITVSGSQGIYIAENILK